MERDPESVTDADLAAYDFGKLPVVDEQVDSSEELPPEFDWEDSLDDDGDEQWEMPGIDEPPVEAAEGQGEPEEESSLEGPVSGLEPEGGPGQGSEGEPAVEDETDTTAELESGPEPDDTPAPAPSDAGESASTPAPEPAESSQRSTAKSQANQPDEWEEWEDDNAGDDEAGGDGYSLTPSAGGNATGTASQAPPTAPMLNVTVNPQAALANAKPNEQQAPDPSVSGSWTPPAKVRGTVPRERADALRQARTDTKRSVVADPAKPRLIDRLLGKNDDDTGKLDTTDSALSRIARKPINVVVWGGKGGGGTTTVSALLGMKLASVRRGHIVAVDASPRGGSLRSRCPQEGEGTRRRMINDLKFVSGYPDILEYTCQGPTGLEVLGERPQNLVEPVTGDEYREMMAKLRDHYEVIISDAPAGLADTAAKDRRSGLADAVIDEADMLVIISDGKDGMEGAAARLNWLKNRLRATKDARLEQVINRVVVVVNQRVSRSNANANAIVKVFKKNVPRGHVVTMPFDVVLEGGGEIPYSKISGKTRDVVAEIGAAIVSAPVFAGR